MYVTVVVVVVVVTLHFTSFYLIDHFGHLSLLSLLASGFMLYPFFLSLSLSLFHFSSHFLHFTCNIYSTSIQIHIYMRVYVLSGHERTIWSMMSGCGFKPTSRIRQSKYLFTCFHERARWQVWKLLLLCICVCDAEAFVLWWYVWWCMNDGMASSNNTHTIVLGWP